MFKSFSMDLAGRTLTVEVGRVAKQANGAAFMHYGDTVVLSTATASEKPRDGIDFFPLSVEYEEKLYAVGKIPGGFTKREGKASENAILTARVIDRPMRPLFPKDYRNDVTLDNIVMSVDPDCSPELTAMLGSAIATSISDIPFDGPCATTQVGLIDGEFVINPTSAQKQVSDLALTVASTREKVIMIEAGANEVPEQTMIDAIFKAHEVNQEIIRFIDRIVAECGKEKHDYEHYTIPEELFAAIREIVPPEEMESAVFTDDKQTREENIRLITERLEREFGLDLISTAPNVPYEVTAEDNTVHRVTNPSEFPDGKIKKIVEPMVAADIITPKDFIGSVMDLCQDHRGIMGTMEYISTDRVEMHYRIPLAEIVFDFFDQLKSRTKGYASLDYHEDGEQAADLVKVDILIQGEKVDAFSAIVHRDKAYSYGVMMTKKLRELIPRQQFEIPIQAAIGSRIIARETIRALRKDVLAKCYGGDITRKRKLLEKQKAGKKRMKNIGNVEVPQEAFMAVLKLDDE